MRAVLVGSIGDSKLYYDLDSKDRASDAIVQKQDGSLVVTSFFSLISKSNAIKKIKNTRFHEAIWGGTNSMSKKDWESIFMQKREDVPEAMTTDLKIITDLKQPKKNTKNNGK